MESCVGHPLLGIITKTPTFSQTGRIKRIKNRPCVEKLSKKIGNIVFFLRINLFDYFLGVNWLFLRSGSIVIS